jgi:phage-related protein
MAKDSIKISPETLEELSQKFTDGAGVIDNIMKEVNNLDKLFTNYYVGFASEIIVELYGKVNEHLDILKSCYMNTADYVTDVKEELQETDEKISSQIQGR